MLASIVFFLAGGVVGTGLYFGNLGWVRVHNEAGSPTLRFLGTPDFNGYCEATGQGRVVLVASDAAYGWHCSAAKRTGDDASAVCAWTYRLSSGQVTSKVTNFYNPNTWQCWRITRQLRPPDFNGYCQATGHGAVRLIKNTVYGWYCKDETAGINVDTVCAWTNNAPAAISRFQDFYDPRSWQCWE